MKKLRTITGFQFSCWILLGLFLNTPGGAQAEPPTPSSDANGCAAQAEGFLNGRLALWRERLNLADWKISMVMSHASDLKPKTLGNIHWDTSTKIATIRVLAVADYQLSCREALADMELTLVHELVHLELSSLPRSAASRHEEELAVNRIVDALVRRAGASRFPESREAARGSACSASLPAPTW
ncbi:MAG: hypothetical protein ABSH24_36805 [Bryobacteraceae bacterium]|jgi:hypothetical protein